MSIALLRATSIRDLPLVVSELNEVLAVRSLIEGGLIVGYGGEVEIRPCGHAAVVRPAIIRDVTNLGLQFLGAPDVRTDSLGGFW